MTQTKTGDNTAPKSRPLSLIQRACVVIGSCGLLLAMAADTIAVVGRHTGFSLIGSIELVQIAIVLLASSAMVIATSQSAHATVHILTERLSAGAAALLARLAALISALFCVLIIAGSAWVTADLWLDHERTELLHIPLRGFRVLLIAAFVIMAGFFIRHSLRGHHHDA